MMQRPTILNGMEAIVVDRKSQITDTLKTILSQHGCTVSAVATGQEAALVHRRRPCDLIFVDIPDTKVIGQLDLNQVRSDSQTCILPLIAVASEDTGEMRWTCLTAGADVVVRKPLQPGELVRRTATLLEAVRDIGGRMYSRPNVLESVFRFSLTKHRKRGKGLIRPLSVK